MSAGSGSEEVAPPVKPNRPKRGRALTRKVTNEEEVPFMTHVVSGEIVKEFIYEFRANWAIFGTSEVGMAARGCLASQKPAVLFALNDDHEKILRKGLEQGIVESVLAGGDFSSKNLVAQWQALQEESESESSTNSGSQASEDCAPDQASENENKATKDEKENKEKKKSKQKKQNKKHKKKDKKKEEKNKNKKDKKAKKDSGAGSKDVLQALIASGNGNQGPNNSTSS